MRLHSLLCLVWLATGCGESNPCKKACAKLTQCAGGGSEAGPGPAAIAAPVDCPFPSVCESPLQECIATCVAEGACAALTGADPEAALAVAECKTVCATRDLATGPEAATGSDGGATSCNLPRKLCGGVCVDPATSPAHCGSCGHACGSSELCAGGTCQAQSGDCTASGCPKGHYCDLLGKKCLPGCAVDAECGSGARCNLGAHTCCAPGESVCAGSCVNLSSNPAHCSGCNQACPTVSGGHAVCVGGSCSLACDGGRQLCSEACVLTASDPLHCGGCDQPCEKPAGGTVSCVSKSCVTGCSGAGMTVCSGECVDTQTDLANCGGCGTVCPSGGGTSSCTAGKCSLTCPSGKTLCKEACVDLKTDVKNCGYCGKVCPAGGTSTSPSCSAGTCGLNCYSPAVKCVNTCCDPTRYGGSHCCTGTDSYGKTYGYCLKYGYSCY